MPVWIVSSAENDAATDHVRGLLQEATNIMTLLVPAEEDERETCLRALYDIDEHHGRASTAEETAAGSLRRPFS
jgi:hypothetical protein